MKRKTIALEISHKYIKVAAGFVQDDKVYLDFTKKIPINHLIENGAIKEKDALIKELSRMNPIVDQEYLINLLVNNVSLILPPYGLEVYQTHQMTSVISSEKIINELDIKNIYSIIRNKKLPVDNDLIDIIPEAFSIDNGNMYAQAPIGKTSSAITAYTKVYTVPKRINQEYSDVLKGANIQINRKIVSSFAASELLSTYSDIPANYFLVDIGSASTSVSLIGNKTLLATRSFPWGGDNITDRIVSTFNINEVEAEKIKIMFGLDKRQLKFKYPVCSFETENGNNDHYVEELNQIIETELAEFYMKLLIAIEELAKAYSIIDYQTMPLLLIGGGSKLKGIIPYLVSKNEFNTIEALSPRSIGGRDPSMFALLGAIYINHKYPNTRSGDKQINVNVSREE